MSVLIVGADGNMGKRYRAILDHLGLRWVGTDIKHDHRAVRALCKSASRTIIATPTHTHCKYISLLSDMKKPILCEKPISTDMRQLKQMAEICQDQGTELAMVHQYKMLPIGDDGPTYYDYFKHGSDGLYWDCIQIIALATGLVSLKETSPVWKCKINGKALNLGDMDQAYVSFIQKWLKEPGEYGDLDHIVSMHAKVDTMIREGHV